MVNMTNTQVHCYNGHELQSNLAAYYYSSPTSK